MEFNPVYIGALVTLIVAVIAAAVWLGAIHSRVASHDERLGKLEQIAESVQHVAMTIQGDLKAVMANLETIQEELHRRRGQDHGRQ